MTIPANVDFDALLQDLNAWGWRDYKIEIAVGFTKGYVSQLKCGNVGDMMYQRAARLYNFWESEAARADVPRGTLPINRLVTTLDSA